MAISLDSIATGVLVRPPKICIYGVGGVGKTTWAAGAPKPIFAFTEDGQGSLDVARFDLIKSWVDLVACAELLCNEKHDYQTFVIDSIDFAEPLLWAYTCEQANQPDIEAFGFGKGYGLAVDHVRGLFRWLDMLRDKGMAIILISHNEIKRFEAPDTESYDRYQLRLQKTLAAYVTNWVDTLLFANYKAHVVKDKKGGFAKKDDNTRARGVGVGERVIYTEERPAFVAKNRFMLPAELPLSWQAFTSAISIPTATETV